VEITAGDPMSCRVFAFPDEAGLQTTISSLDADMDVADVERL
jgi:chemotaxis protein CheC